MKHHSASPRLACRLIRFWSSVFGDGAPAAPGSLAGRHAARCEPCRRYFAAASEFDGELRRSASGRSLAAPEKLDERIWDAVVAAGAFVPAGRRGVRAGDPLTAGASDERPASWRGWWIGAAAAGLAAAAAVAIFMAPPAPNRPEIATRIAPGGPESSLQPAALEVVGRISQPLQDELGSVYADTRSAIRFLALNFLPSDNASIPTVRPGASSSG